MYLYHYPIIFDSGPYLNFVFLVLSRQLTLGRAIKKNNRPLFDNKKEDICILMIEYTPEFKDRNLDVSDFLTYLESIDPSLYLILTFIAT